MTNELYIYIDESGNPLITTKDNFYLGAFVSPRKISSQIIESALDNLKNSRPNENDLQTIKEKFFHAKNDTNKARQALYNEISKISWACDFIYYSLNKNNLPESFQAELRREKDVHHLLFFFISSYIMISKIKKANIFISERQKSLKKTHDNELNSNIIKSITYSAINNWNIPVFIPEFEINYVDGKNPGNQIVDFLTWAVQRKKSKNENEFLKFLESNNHSGFSGQDNPFNAEYFFINSGITRLKIGSDKLPSTKTIDNLWNNGENIFKGMTEIEKLLLEHKDNGDKINNESIQKRFMRTTSIINGNKFTYDEIIEMSILFLLIADEVPFYDINIPESIEKIYFYKKICSVVANKSNPVGTRLCNLWLDSKS